jgi:hypothetical protein
VDFPDLIERKRQTVEATAELKGAFTGVKPVTDLKAPIVFESDQYVQIGCDLRQLETLRKALESVTDVENCSFLFVAEVSITYMETEGADGVIKWASSFGDSEFAFNSMEKRTMLILDYLPSKASLFFWSRSCPKANSTLSRQPCSAISVNSTRR